MFAGIVTKRGRPLLSTFGSLFLALWHRLLPPIRRCTSRSEFWWIAGITVVLLAGIILARLFWDDLRGDEESLSATVRNLGLVKGGLIAIILAVWRSVVGSRQADTAQRGLLNERYQKGAEMLGSEVLSVRLGGIYALQRLAEEHPEQYHVQVMSLLCAFVRHPIEDAGVAPSQSEKNNETAPLREDVQVIVDVIINRSESQVEFERSVQYRLDLSDAMLRGIVIAGASLSGVDLSGADLSDGFIIERTNLSCAKFAKTKVRGATIGGNTNLYKARFIEAILTDAKLLQVNLSSAILTRADLTGARIYNSDLRETVFEVANLSGTLFTEVHNLTQRQLRHTLAHKNQPPGFEGVHDAETGKLFVWRGHYYHRNDAVDKEVLD